MLFDTCVVCLQRTAVAALQSSGVVIYLRFERRIHAWHPALHTPEPAACVTLLFQLDTKESIT